MIGISCVEYAEKEQIQDKGYSSQKTNAFTPNVYTDPAKNGVLHAAPSHIFTFLFSAIVTDI